MSAALTGSKVVIGDGPDLERLQERYKDAHFHRYRFGAELARCIAGGNVFVFPSRTDTYGLVMLEAMACGLPVAAFPVEGPIDVVRHGTTGFLDQDLGLACRAALELDPSECCRLARTRSRRNATLQVRSYLEPRIRATASDQPASNAVR